jgi:hypothetical protein
MSSSIAIQNLAVCDSPEKLRGDDQFIQALVSGCPIDKAAGTSVRTAYRLLADPEFRSLRQGV